MYLVIIFLTLISSLTVGFFGRFFGFYGSAMLATSCLILAFLVSIFIFYEVAFVGCFSYIKLISWMSSETLNVDWGFMFDSLTAVICLCMLFFNVNQSYILKNLHKKKIFGRENFLSIFSFSLDISYYYHFSNLFIFFVVLILVCLVLSEKIFSSFSKNYKLLLFLGFGIFFLYLKYYVLGVYMFVGAILLYLGVSKLKFDKSNLELENHKIHCEVLPEVFELKYYHIIFMIGSLSLALFFNIVLGGFYFMFIIAGFIGGFFKLNIYNLIPKKVYFYSKNFRKDLNTMKYHWGTRFFFFKVFNRLTLVSLPLSLLILAFALPFHPKDDPVLLLNFLEICSVLLVTFIGSFLLDVYIILYGNSSILNKFGVFCYRCASFGAIGGYVGFVVEKQFIHNSFDRLGLQWQPTFFTNGPRIIVNQPIFLDSDQYWQYMIVQKYLPEITHEQYTIKRNFVTSQIDSTKINKVLIENWDVISQNATREELGKIRLGQGYTSSIIQRK